jgi:hypothetical protein
MVILPCQNLIPSKLVTACPSAWAATSSPMAAAATSSWLLRRPISCALLLRRASPRLLRTTLCYSTSASTTATPAPPPSSPDTSEGYGGGGMRWDSMRKKRVVLRVGYVGTEYRGFARLPIHFLPGRPESDSVICSFD